MNRRLAGRSVVTTRDEPGRLDELLVAEGAEVIHMPLIEIAEPHDGGAGLGVALASIAEVQWLIVTSKHGARRVGPIVAMHPHLRLGAVGSRTAAELGAFADRDVDVVPDRQTAADLVAAMPSATPGERVLVVQADRADRSLADGLTDRGFDVDAVTGYATRLRSPGPGERKAASGADAVAFASGSAAIAWVEAIGATTPPIVATIGPTTAGVARRSGLVVTHVASDHSIRGLADCLIEALDRA